MNYLSINYERDLLHEEQHQKTMDMVFTEFGLKTIRLQKPAYKKVFSKPYSEIVTNYSELNTVIKNEGLPIMLGLSRKRFIKDISGLNDSKKRIGGTISSCIFSILQGVQILRVHDVNEVKQGIKVFKKFILDEGKLVATVRLPRGDDVLAACGQLKSF